MVLIVDQAAVNDVLVAVANSRLKIQITQVHMVHVPDPGPVVSDTTTTPDGGLPAPPGTVGTVGPYPDKRKPLPGGGGPMPPEREPRPPSSTGPLQPGFPYGPGTTETEPTVEDNNLFELTVYGVATLYERYPKREPKAVPDSTTTPPPVK
jgi:hypothetical protein